MMIRWFFIILVFSLLISSCQKPVIPEEELLNLREKCWEMLVDELTPKKRYEYEYDTNGNLIRETQITSFNPAIYIFQSIGIAGDRRAIPILSQILEEWSNNDVDIKNILAAIRSIGDPSGIAIATKFAEHSDWETKATAILTMIKLGDQSKFKQICKETEERWMEKQDASSMGVQIKLGYQSASYMLIGAIKDVQTYPSRVKSFGGPDLSISLYSSMLGEIEDIRIAPLIRETISSSENIEVKTQGAKALAKMGYSDDEMKNILKANINNERYKKICLEGLAYAGDYTDIPLLKSLLNDQDKEIRNITAGALIRIINRLLNNETKSAGIPTDEYRKTHPWPKEKEPDKPNEQNK